MVEYIERETLLSEIERREALMVGDKLISVYAMKSFIKNRPAADVAPVKRGGWKKIGYKWVCSNCRSRLTLRGTPTDNNIFYCPACGAKMDLGENNGEA